MKWYYNMKISAKLIIAFLLVALITGIVGAVGIVNITKIDRNYSSLYTDYGIAMGDIGKVSINYQRRRISMRDMILDKGNNSHQKYKDQITTYDKNMNESLTKLEETLNTEAEKTNFEKLTTAIKEFEPIQNQIIELCLAGKQDEALQVLRTEKAVELVVILNENIDKLFDAKVTTGVERSQAYSDSTTSTVYVSLGIIAFAMVLAIALGIFISKVIGNPVKKLLVVAEKIADGDLDVTLQVDTKDEIGNLGTSFIRMSDNLNEVLTNISTASEQVAAGSKQVSDSSLALSEGATEQASSVEQLTASIEEISSQTQLNAENAHQANQLAELAKLNAEKGNNQMQEMLGAMDDINDSSNNIYKIIKVIDEIAFQTNILALNAAVEAARAGQHGKGFAVVAEEVRNLAARSANAAKETTDMIEGSISKVAGGTKIANETAKALNDIVDGISKVANLVGDIAVASSEQSSGIDQINQGVMQISEVVQTNSATSEESAAASEELSSQADLLKEQISRFKLKKNNSFNGYRDLDPEVLRLLESMRQGNKNNQNMAYKEAAITKSKSIALSDNEFGKY